ncbi:glycosyltransferase [Sphingomonas sp. PAMC 26621]|uniref:glycosyltransferase n=1 Tax=Sphingomonas sp. PAMC 26621 TaxID=1112213 RepID=UPI0002882884|nr:glycosyltransferase [Sphingomonas sp. PAMC 26621]
MRKIVLTTAGTFGDLHPFIAIALALRERGITPVLAVPEDHVQKCTQAGLEAVGVLTSFAEICAGMGLGHEDAVRRIMSDQRIMLERVLLPGLSKCTVALDALVADAEAIVASIFVFAAPIVAEKRRLPLVSVILQPMAMLSPYDPPRTLDFWMMLGAPMTGIGVAWNRFAFGALRRLVDRLYGKRIDRVRFEHGLPAGGAAHLLDPPPTALLRLGCYSPQLGALPPDATQTTRIVGFPLFDQGSGGKDPLHPAIVAFLEAGPAPLVFTLGSFAVNGPGRFYEKASDVAKALHMRAILLVGGTDEPSIDGDILRVGYAQHSLLFPHVAVIIQHGGVGTTGQALRVGKPQLVVPHMGDQYDHAYRVMRMGTGLRLKARHFTVRRATRLIARLLHSPTYRETAERVAAAMADENGADTAADTILVALDALAASRG